MEDEEAKNHTSNRPLVIDVGDSLIGDQTFRYGGPQNTTLGDLLSREQRSQTIKLERVTTQNNYRSNNKSKDEYRDDLTGKSIAHGPSASNNGSNYNSIFEKARHASETIMLDTRRNLFPSLGDLFENNPLEMHEEDKLIEDDGLPFFDLCVIDEIQNKISP